MSSNVAFIMLLPRISKERTVDSFLDSIPAISAVLL